MTCCSRGRDVVSVFLLCPEDWLVFCLPRDREAEEPAEGELAGLAELLRLVRRVGLPVVLGAEDDVLLLGFLRVVLLRVGLPESVLLLLLRGI